MNKFKDIIKTINKEELYNYYIKENHTFKECSSYFGISSFPVFKKVCNYFNICKNESFDNILKRVNKEDVINYYIDGNHTKEECLEKFKFKEDSWAQFLNYYNIEKPRNLLNLPNASFIVEKIIKEYTDEGLSLETIAFLNHTSFNNIKKTLEENNVKLRNRADSLKISLNKKYQKEGKEEVENRRVERIKETNLKKYGVENCSQLSSVKEKRKNTNLKKYGVDNWFKTQECREKLSLYNEKNLNSKGFLNPNQINLPEKLQKLLYNKEESIKFLSSLGKPTLDYLQNYFYPASITTIVHWISRLELKDYITYNMRGLENEIEKLLISFNIGYDRSQNRGDRKFLSNGQELDFYFPNYKIAIEVNGTYWHSSLQKNKNYHLNKSKECEKLGIRLIHIWEYEWRDELKKQNIINMLKVAFNKVEHKLYARKCIIKKINNKEAKEFNNKNHIQGHRSAQITYGLFYENYLVQLMSFSKTKYNRNLKNEDSWEIIRGCSSPDTIIVGGVSKLLNYFIKYNNPKEIFSYCDFNKFDGTSYLKSGMKFIGYTGPDMKWLLKTGEVVNRCPSKHKEIKENSIAQLWGAGSKKYILQNNFYMKP